MVDVARGRAESALFRAVYFLDRDQAPSGKVRAFRHAIDVVRELDDLELVRLVDQGAITELAGIGPSTGSVISAAVRGERNAYLDELDAKTTIDPGEGGALRTAIRGDLHSHTTWSDGGADLATMARTARELGHDYLAVTDHSARLTVAHGLDEARLRQQLAIIEVLNRELAPFRILTGMEVDIFEDGALDLDEVLLAELDVVVASVHSTLRMPEAEMTRRMAVAAAHPHVDILGHCTGRLLVGRGRPPSTFNAPKVFEACAQFDTAVEINCRPERQDPPDDLLEIALERGCRVAIDTDAHAPGQLEWQAYGCDKAARHGIPEDTILNTWTVDELLSLTRVA